MFDRALPLAEQGGKRALAAEARDDPFGGIRSLFQGRPPNEFFVIVADPGAGDAEEGAAWLPSYT
jgi:hypothetical protein